MVQPEQPKTTMNTQTQRKEIEELERRLKAKRDALTHAERICQHQWSEPQPDHIYREGYTDPGDTPGTMGVDFRGPCYIPPQTTKRWKRTCALCGKIEHTSQVTKIVTERPTFG